MMNEQPSRLVTYLKRIGLILAGIGGALAAINEFVKLYGNIEVTRLVEVIGFAVVLGYLLIETKQALPNRRWIGMTSFGIVGIAFTFLTAWWIWGDNRLLNSPLVYPIEKAGVTSFGYGTGFLSETLRLTASDIEHTFRMDYTLSDAEPTYAGFTLAISNRFDITPFRAVRFTIQFSDDQGEVRLSLKDANGNASHIGLDPFVGYLPMPQTVDIPLTAFDRNKVDFTSLRWIDFYTDNTLIKGQHHVIVSNLEFVK